MDLGLHNKVVMVAASSKGLGFGVAQASAQEGARVSLCSRTEADVLVAAERIRTETQSETLATACDVLDAAQIENWVQRTVSAWAVGCVAGQCRRSCVCQFQGIKRRAVACSF
jgi:NAD(P)-dependent dehydrogenase (short-subunit alcohol dehydrogenase family)